MNNLNVTVLDQTASKDVLILRVQPSIADMNPICRTTVNVVHLPKGSHG